MVRFGILTTPPPTMKHWVHPLLALALASLGCSHSGGGGGGVGGGGVPVAGQDVLFYPFTGVRSVLFIIVKFDNAPALFSEDALGEAEVQSILADVADAASRNSYGQLSLDIGYTWPPLLISKNTGAYAPETALVHVRSDAIQVAKQAGYAVDSYDREVIFTQKVWTQSFARGWVRTVWMPHKLRWVAVHELGHTLSWGHADFWDGDPVGAGVAVQYGDIYDPMGTGQQWNRFLHFSPWFKHRAGWVPEQDVLTVTQSGTYTLTTLEHPNPAEGATALRIRREAGSDYWIFHRGTEPLVSDGPVIVRTGANPYRGALLLDMNPGSPGSEVVDAALARGQTFDDSAVASITVENVTQAGPVTLDITVDPVRQMTLDNPPTIDVLQPARDQGPISGTVDYEVVAYDRDVGENDGDGISKVKLGIFAGNSFDPNPAGTVATTEILGPPYRWSFDTTSGLTKDGFYYLAVTATAVDGSVTSIWYRTIIDNYTVP